ncbi:hypothetical protein ETH_00039240 [Eimeria tenella]|uniref:Uncharacterized protein n=1 Tax=Eimeria tenella TaxID=5802 RepID=U6KMG6_EIMTE|nr:hypothetical protein ETH_00039240 [Eimeria tenella]CDJ39302.1 hypothetical protein ETH_00039240 [Eimeria tenella]|eukprot:XP_013230057.1 hypothetical protein ETH_00039240 [Eimeria tenella]
MSLRSSGGPQRAPQQKRPTETTKEAAEAPSSTLMACRSLEGSSQSRGGPPWDLKLAWGPPRGPTLQRSSISEHTKQQKMRTPCSSSS